MRRDDTAKRRCKEVYDDAAALHEETSRVYGGISLPLRTGAFRAWHEVVDAWEVAEDACREAREDGLANSAAHLSHRIINIMRSAYSVSYAPRTGLERAERALKYAQHNAERVERVSGIRGKALTDDSVRWDFEQAAHAFDDAGASRRAAAIRRYLRMSRMRR